MTRSREVAKIQYLDCDISITSSGKDYGYIVMRNDRIVGNSWGIDGEPGGPVFLSQYVAQRVAKSIVRVAQT